MVLEAVAAAMVQIPAPEESLVVTEAVKVVVHIVDEAKTFIMDQEEQELAAAHDHSPEAVEAVEVKLPEIKLVALVLPVKSWFATKHQQHVQHSSGQVLGLAHQE